MIETTHIIPQKVVTRRWVPVALSGPMRRVGIGQDAPEAMARRLRALRGALKKTQKEMTRISGSHNRGQKWANFESLNPNLWRRIGLDSALTLCRETDVTLEWIYRGDPSGLPEKLLADIREWRLANPED